MSKIRANISIEVDETFDVDVKLGIDEMVQFFENCDPEDKVRIRKALKIGPEEYGGKTLEDQLKISLCLEAMKKYTLEELETKLK